ncbi:MAG: biotin--[acetyl-CoA-carboxylase] ligase [Chloroflexota bacterium]
MTDDLSEAAVLPELTTHWLGRSYHYVPEIGSTNDRLKAWVDTGTDDPPAGTVLLTDYQSKGRGRLDRRWEAPPRSSLLFSTLFRPDWPAQQGGWLTMLAGLAIAEAIEQVTGTVAGLKWPNDVMVQVDGVWHKAGGLLLDARLDGDRLAYAIVGAGINVNIPEAVLPDAVTPATSLMVATGNPVSRRPLLLACLSRLEQGYEAADRGESPQPAWNDRLMTLGEHVTVSTNQDSVALTGIAEATDEWGGLLVRTGSGKLHSVAAGDVTLRRL